MVQSTYSLIELTIIIISLFSVLVYINLSKNSNYSAKNSANYLELTNLPNLNDLLELEKVARKEGSNVTLEPLIGVWKFVSVWKPLSDKEDFFTSLLLRKFSACLQLSKAKNIEDQTSFLINNSIKFGLLQLKFSGEGKLVGNQPRLIFYFDSIELYLSSKNVFKRSIPIPEDKNKPFFLIVSMSITNSWLSGRGRGGGLALWQKS
ncbi:hypothetical protein [Prochlorococcus sp. MIT 1223]|uniref:hypothetical protein n=1 Tax=Prochlorococcus sp. MIT 1223 TaxID=3096217 RepID=UPI002A74F13F|nr:hypothetical protein [Prochlorococcus sp. MIT 1223]